MNSWEWFLGGLGGFVIIPYLWFKGKKLEETAEKSIKIAGYIGIIIIILFLFVLFKKA